MEAEIVEPPSAPSQMATADWLSITAWTGISLKTDGQASNRQKRLARLYDLFVSASGEAQPMTLELSPDAYVFLTKQIFGLIDHQRDTFIAIDTALVRNVARFSHEKEDLSDEDTIFLANSDEIVRVRSGNPRSSNTACDPVAISWSSRSISPPILLLAPIRSIGSFSALNCDMRRFDNAS
ncbi:MAG: hypothetical protein KDA87_16635 [Planctomycetales bacterium]|nr:hypothetical protein [Planctomycetales bacterium]